MLIARRADMVFIKGQETSLKATLAALEAIAPRPSPASKFNIYRDGSVKRAAKLREQQQRSQKLNAYCDEVTAEIRASLDRTPPR